MEQDILIEGYIEGLFLNEEVIFLDESLKEFVKKLTPPKLKQFLSNTFKHSAAKDMKGFMALSKRFGLDPKKIKPKEAKNFADSMPEDIKQGAQLAGRVIKNSVPKASKSAVFNAGYFVAVMAKVKYPRATNYMGSVKSELKNYIGKVREFYEESEQEQKAGKRISLEDVADMALAIGTVIGLTVVGVLVIGAFAVVLAWAVVFAIIAMALATLRFAIPAAKAG